MLQPNAIIRAGVSAAFALVLATACGPVDRPAPTPDTKAQSRAASLIATVQLQHGARVEFHEPVSGQLLVIGLSKTGQALPHFDALKHGQLEPLALYRKLSDREPPAELVAAQQRARDAARDSAKASAAADARKVEGASTERLAPPSTRVDGDIAVRQSALSSSTFMTNYCATSSYYNFKYCWLNTGGYSWARYWSQSMYATVNALYGSVAFSMRTWNVLWWNTTQIFVPQSWTMQIYSTGGFTNRWTEANGISYHMSVFGRIL